MLMAASVLFKKVKNIFLNQNDSVWLILLLAIATLSASITIFGGDLNGRNFSTPFFYSSFVFVFVWFGFKLYFLLKNKDASKIKVLIVLGTAFLIGMINIIVQTPFSAYSFNYFKKVTVTFTVLIIIFLSSFGVFHSVVKFTIPSIAIFLSIEIAISFFSGIGQIYANQTSKNLLYFTFGNSNAAGICFALLILINFYGMILFKKIYIKFIFFMPIIFLVFLLYKTHARNAVYAIILSFFVLLLLKLNSAKNKKTYDFIVLAIACSLPIVVISLYTALATKTNILDFINYVLSTPGKTTTSRIATWVSAFKHLKGIHFLIGDYYNSTSLAYNLFQTLPGYQNSQIDFFVDAGFVPALFIISFLFLCVFNRIKGINKTKTINFLPVTLWLFTIFSSIFEVGLFIGVSVWYIFGFTLLSLGSFSKEGILVKNDDFSYYVITV